MTHTCTHTRTRSRAHTRKHTHAHTHTHARTHALRVSEGGCGPPVRVTVLSEREDECAVCCCAEGPHEEVGVYNQAPQQASFTSLSLAVRPLSAREEKR